MTEQPDDIAQADEAPPGLNQRPTDLAVSDVPRRAIASRQWAGVATARTRLAELAANPAVVATATATATVGTGVALSLLRQALKSTALSQSRVAAPVAVTLHIVQHVHVVHHVVHHVSRPMLPPG